jgi:SNF2 family DNA or RNA helicase
MITKTKPYKHQIQAYNKLYGKEFSALFMEQGTGKSKVAIDIACNLYHNHLIDAVLLIAPNGVHTQWANEQIPIHSSAPDKICVWSTKKTKKYQADLRMFLLRQDPCMLKWFCVNVDTFSSQNHLSTFINYVKEHNTYIIVDESTRIKNPKANRTFNICYMLGEFKKRYKQVTKVIPYSKYRSILTGTIITNSPYDLWSMFEFLSHNYFKVNFFAFKSRYGIEIRDTHPATGREYFRSITPKEIHSILKYHEQKKDPIEISFLMGTTVENIRHILRNPAIRIPYKHLEELKEKIEPVSFIVRKVDCLDLPPKIYEKLYVEMLPEQKKVYKNLKDRLLAEYEGKELTVINKLTLIGRLQQVTGGFFPYTDELNNTQIKAFSGNPKLNRLRQDIEEAGDEKLIIWARFIAELNTLYTELKKAFPQKNIQLYYGGTSKEDRSQIIEDFKNGLVDIFIANPRTAGTGLNLQRSRFQYFYSNSYSLEDREQAEDRSHRIGIKQTVLYKDIIMKETIDESVHRVLSKKKDLLNYFREKSLKEFLVG